MTVDNDDNDIVTRDLTNSRVLGVHVWSGYNEVNDFVSLIYDAYFKD